VLRVECTKCARKGRYQVHKLIAKYGRNGKHDGGAGHCSDGPLVRKLANGSECRLPYQFRVIAPIIDFIKTNRHTVRVERQ